MFILRNNKRLITIVILALFIGSFILACQFNIGNESSPAQETSDDDPMKYFRNPEIEPKLEELIGEPGDTTVIVWYDIDIGPTTNARPEQGWWPLNPNHPDQVQVDGHFRTTTPLLGLYDCRDPKTAYQHAYWISAMGGEVFAIDFTNFSSPRGEDEPPHMVTFWDGILKNTEVLYDTLSKIEEFDAPGAYPVMRMSGLSPGDTESDLARFQLAMDDVYEIYEKYPDQWFKLDDGTDRADKPFITIFAHWDTLIRWIREDGPYYDDPRFNIRWSNGGLRGSTVSDDQGYKRIEADVDYWMFSEWDIHPDPKYANKGYTYPFYKVSPQNDRIEQMIAQAAIHRFGGRWDGLTNVIDGKYTFTRSMMAAFELYPQTLLVNRFNYANAWKAESQEGLSLTDSIHIEPNEDWGFKIFDIVTNDIYKLKHLDKTPPPAPEVITVDLENRRLGINLENYPLEYRISSKEDMEESEWLFLNVSQGGIKVPGYMDIYQGVYIQTRNTFGESEISLFSGE